MVVLAELPHLVGASTAPSTPTLEGNRKVIDAFTSQETLHGDDMYQVDVDSMTQFASQPN